MLTRALSFSAGVGGVGLISDGLLAVSTLVAGIRAWLTRPHPQGIDPTS